MNYLKKTLDWSERILTYIAMVFLVGMVIIVSTTVFTRYFFNFTVRWSDEVALLLMIWFGFIGIAIGVKRSIHLSIEYFMSLLPERFQKWVLRIENLLVALFGWFMVDYGWKLYQSARFTRLPATQWSRSMLFVMVPIAGVFIVVYALAKIFGLIDQEITKVMPHVAFDEITTTNKQS